MSGVERTLTESGLRATSTGQYPWHPMTRAIPGDAAATVSEPRANVGQAERIVSGVAGSILALLGLGRRDAAGLLIAGIGGALVYRGATGHCPAYETLGIDSAHDQIQLRGHRSDQEFGAHISESFLIDRSPEELYAYWRDLENLPKIMTHLISVSPLGNGRSHWIAKAPSIAGGKVEWDAEIVADEPNMRIDWRSLPGSGIENQGSVRFVRALGDRGTAVRVKLHYRPPAGQVGRWVAKLFGEEPEQQIREDLRNFKRTMEVGEVITVAGQTRGTCMGQGRHEGG